MVVTPRPAIVVIIVSILIGTRGLVVPAIVVGVTPIHLLVAVIAVTSVISVILVGAVIAVTPVIPVEACVAVIVGTGIAVPCSMGFGLFGHIPLTLPLFLRGLWRCT